MKTPRVVASLAALALGLTLLSLASEHRAAAPAPHVLTQQVLATHHAVPALEDLNEDELRDMLKASQEQFRETQGQLKASQRAHEELQTQLHDSSKVVSAMQQQLQEASKSSHACTATATGRRYVHSPETIPYKPNDLVMMTYATGGVAELLKNWVRHVQRIQTPILVAAMDIAVVNQCVDQSFDCLDWSNTAVAKDMEYVRGDFSGFRALGVRKLDALLSILAVGVHVVLSDVDCVWSRSPDALVRGWTAGYEAFAQADLIVATDCMSPEGDYEADGCYNDIVDKNTGVLAVRATADGIASMREWRIRIAVAEKDEQDQTTFMDLMDGNGRGHRWGLDSAGRMKWAKFAAEWCIGRGFSTRSVRGYSQRLAPPPAAAGASHKARSIFNVCVPNITATLKLGVFPITEVAGGHTFFIQQLQTPTGFWPMAVHATYQYGDMPDYPFGKRQRFRDWGMWLVDEDREMVGEGQFLVLEDDEPVAPEKQWVGNVDLHVRGRQHVEHLERTRQRLAHGVALARVLNRTVVLPTLWCYCDKYWHRLDQCAIPSAQSSQLLPFKCPIDHVIDPAFWHGTPQARKRRPRKGMLAARADGAWEEGMPYRSSYWLRTIGAHPKVGLSTARLTATTLDPAEGARRYPAPRQLITATKSPSAAAAGVQATVTQALVSGEDGPRLILPPGQSDVQLLQALGQYSHVKLLRVSLSSAKELLGCFAKQRDVSELETLTEFLFRHKWCYRPKEMLAEWKDMYQWCVWGFKTPTVPQQCAAVTPPPLLE